jgi:hypothetical protein
MGQPAPNLLLLFYGNAWEARTEGKSLGWFATEQEARKAVASCG